jgi:hypothetical protein
VRKNLLNIKASARVSRMPFGFLERAGEKVDGRIRRFMISLSRMSMALEV